MSKKATRRAARDAFPKAPVPTKPGAKYAARPAGGKYTSKAAKERAKTQGGQMLKPPTWKKSLIVGLFLAVIFFLMTYYWRTGDKHPTVWGALLVSAIGFIFFTLISYFTDKWTYERRKKKLQGSGK
jgi:hypothetical protein